jgi:2-methylcitrate dehydratase
MTFQRDLAWQELELLHRSSISYQLARYALALRYDLLPEVVVHQAKRCLLDALGCAVGAYEAPGRPICEEVVKELGGTPEATVIGSGLRTSASNANLVNSFLVRFLDTNDIGGGGHNSDSIPAILAVSERERAGGRDFLTSLVISYEVGARVKESTIGSSWEERGWCMDIRAGLNMPPALGKLMGLNEEQIANAIGSSACGNITTQILDADKEEYCMRKNIRFGAASSAAIVYCMLAKKGFTGPVRIVEGDGGWRQVLVHGEMDLERLMDFSGWRILATRHKTLCTNGTNHGTVLATLAITKEQDLRPEDVALVRLKAPLREANHARTAAKKYPRNAETADHSTYYLNAVAIKERSIGPDSVESDKFTDPVILDLIEKMTVEIDPNMPPHSSQGISEITTTDGRKFTRHVTTPHGFGDDPLTDSELEGKFAGMARRYMGEQQIKEIIDTVWNVERLEDMGDLMRLLVFPAGK